MTTEEEDNFILSIHAKFPYHDKEECLRLIEKAASISFDSMFKVVEEICRIYEPDKSEIGSPYLHELLLLMASKFEHPLKSMIVDAASKMIDNQDLEVDDVSKRMEIVKSYPGQYSALSILYFSCDDTEEKLEPIWDDIIAHWKKNGT